MRDLNKMILIGRLGKDPMLIDTRSGMPCVKFSLATTYRTKVEGAEGQYKDETQWHRVVVFGKQAEHCLQYLKKGAPVFIDGTLRSHEYEAKDGSGKRTSYEVIADSVIFLGAPKRQGETTHENPGPFQGPGADVDAAQAMRMQ